MIVFEVQLIRPGFQRSFLDRERSFPGGHPSQRAFCDPMKPEINRWMRCAKVNGLLFHLFLAAGNPVCPSTEAGKAFRKLRIAPSAEKNALFEERIGQSNLSKPNSALEMPIF